MRHAGQFKRVRIDPGRHVSKRFIVTVTELNRTRANLAGLCDLKSKPPSQAAAAAPAAADEATQTGTECDCARRNKIKTEAVSHVSAPGFLGQSSSRAASQTNVYLESFGYQENQAFDTMSVDSTDSIETSISACSPDNVSRYQCFFASAVCSYCCA